MRDRPEPRADLAEVPPRTDGAVAFRPERVAGARRSWLPLAVFGLGVAGLVGAGLVGRAGGAPAADSAVAVPRSSPTPPRLVLTSPSHDGAVARHGRVEVIGFVQARTATVVVAVGDAADRFDSRTVEARPHPGDPAADRRVWFRTSIDVRFSPTTRPLGGLWVEVTLVDEAGAALAVVERTMRADVGVVARAPAGPTWTPVEHPHEQGTDGVLGPLWRGD